MQHYRVNGSNFSSLRADLPSGRWFEMEREVQQIADSPGWEIVASMTEEAREYWLHRMTSDYVDDPALMARMAGVVEGLRVAEAAIKSVLEKAQMVREQLDRLEQSAEQGG